MARSIWKGTLGFGLVNIGVELVPLEAPEHLDLDLLDRRDMARIGYRKINKATGKAVDAEHIARGYKVSADHYVLLDDEDLRAANPKATQSIELLGFLAADAIPPLYFAKPYLLAPTRGSEKAYRLLHDTLAEEERLGLGTVVVRTRQYLCAVYPEGRFLIAQMLRYHEELRDPEDVATAPGRPALRPAETTMARKLVASMAIDWEPAAYKDEYRADVLALVKRLAKKGAKAVREVAEPVQETKVLDLMAALERSMGRGGRKAAPKRAAKKRPARRSA